MRNILIADSGATSTNWSVINRGVVIHSFVTEGISPIHQSEKEIITEMKSVTSAHIRSINIDAIRFYGAGCIAEKIDSVNNAIKQSFNINDIKVHSDLIAVAHALCGKSSGIACIMGTGSNSCEWNGTDIVSQVPALGFILGDEGSGAALGKLLVGDILKNQLSEQLKDKFLKQYNLTQSDILNHVYRQPFPSRFLSNLSTFILQNIDDDSLRGIAERSFNDFFERNVMQYNYHDNDVNIVGSVGWHYSDIIRDVASKKGVTIGKIEKDPMKGLVKYYSEG